MGPASDSGQRASRKRNAGDGRPISRCPPGGRPEMTLAAEEVAQQSKFSGGRTMKKSVLFTLVVGTGFWLLGNTVVRAQEIPGDYQEVLKTLDRKGDFKAGVLKVNVPRNDLKMTVEGVSTPTPFGFGGGSGLAKR